MSLIIHVDRVFELAWIENVFATLHKCRVFFWLLCENTSASKRTYTKPGSRISIEGGQTLYGFVFYE